MASENYTTKLSGQFRGLRTSTGAADMRGAVDFTAANKFNLYETGHSLIKVLSVPKFMTAWANKYKESDFCNSFYQIIEQEFRGLSGLDDMSADSMEITDGISTLNVLGKVNYATNQEISLRYTEKAGSTLSRYAETYLRGIRDPRTLVKHYNGCLDLNATGTFSFDPAACEAKYKSDETACPPGFENEVFTFLYIVMDNTWLNVERAYLLCNCQLTKASLGDLHNSEKGSIDLKEIELTFNTFVVTNANVNAAARKYLKKIQENYTLISNNFNYKAQEDLNSAADYTANTDIEEANLLNTIAENTTTK